MKPILCRHCYHVMREDTRFTHCPVCGGPREAADNWKRNYWIACGLFTLGLFLGLWAGGASLLMRVSGHGWMSAGEVCWVAIFTGPATGIAWGLRRRLAGAILAIGLLVVALGANTELAYLTMREGASYALHLFQVNPGFMFLWAVAWFGWQLLAVWIVAASVRKWFQTAA